MSYRVRQYHNRKTTEQKIVESLLKGLWWLVSLPFRLIFGRRRKAWGQNQETVRGVDQQYVRDKWVEIEQLLALGRPSNNARAVLEADKLLDHVLKGMRVPGLTMGDRLKASEKRFSPEGYDAAWKAHKVRNELVHNSQFELMNYHAKEAIENFHRAIDELIK